MPLLFLSGFTFKDEQSRSNLIKTITQLVIMCASLDVLHTILSVDEVKVFFFFCYFWQLQKKSMQHSLCSKWPQHKTSPGANHRTDDCSHPSVDLGGVVNLGKKKTWRKTQQYVRRLTISPHSSRASEFKQLSCLSDPLWGINGLVERCFRRCLPAPQEPERAIRVRGRGSEGTRVWAKNYTLTEEGMWKWWKKE